jgi:hypothetical protein
VLVDIPIATEQEIPVVLVLLLDSVIDNDEVVLTFIIGARRNGQTGSSTDPYD